MFSARRLIAFYPAEKWYTLAEDLWYIVGEYLWYILGECHWYIIGCSVTQGIDGIIQRSVLREQGIAIAGPAPRDLIDPVPPDDLRRASIGILHEWWQPQLQDQYRLLVREYQAYAVLTLCRILFTLQFGEVVSKRRAACWAQETLDRRWNALIGRASNWQPDDGVADLGETLELIRFTLNHTACEAP